MAFVYLLECADGTYYTGWTMDLSARLESHNAGTGSRYTRGRLPVRLAYSEYAPSKSEAMRREAALRRLSHNAKSLLAAAQAAASEVKS
jgi:putative endonuclease